MELDKVPGAFIELYRTGRFDYWGAPYQALTGEQRAERIRTHESQVLWWSSIEWDRTLEEVLAFTGDDVLRPGLTPFAGNGCGDMYCWYPQWQTEHEPPVVLFLHDEVESTLFANNFSQCLVRCCLQHFATADMDDMSRHLWYAHLEILRPVLHRRDFEALAGIGRHLSNEACQKADDEYAERFRAHKLRGSQPPTRYNHQAIRDPKTLANLYDQSIQFYRSLIQDEGLRQFQPRLDEATAMRASLS